MQASQLCNFPPKFAQECLFQLSAVRLVSFLFNSGLQLILSSNMLVDVARKQGAHGAKLTGGGGGGCMVALTQGKELQAKVAGAIKDLGFEVLMTRIGVET
jgi:hypothetical protein